MTIRAYLDSFAVSTGIAGTTQVRTYGFKPKARIMWGFGLTSATSVTFGGVDLNGSIGLVVSPSSRVSVGIQEVDADPTPLPVLDIATDAVFHDAVGAGTGKLDLQSVQDDGDTFVIDSQFAAAKRAFSLVLGGSAIADVALASITGPASPGAKSFTGLPFRPTGAILILPSGGGIFLSIGAAVSALGGAITQKCVRISADQGDPTDTSSSTTIPAHAATFDSMDGSTLEIDVTGWTADGAATDWAPSGFTDSGGFTLYGLFFRTVPEDALTLREVATTTSTSTDIPVSGLQAAPSFGLAISPDVAAPGGSGAIVVGAFTQSANQCHGYQTLDDVGASDVGLSIDYEDFHKSFVGGQMRVNRFTHDGVVFRMSTGDSIPANESSVLLLLGAARPMARGAPIFF